MFARRNKRFSPVRSLMALVLFTGVAAMALDARSLVTLGNAVATRAARAAGQAPTEGLRFPELDAGFHLLYELKPAEARAQFGAWQKSHPQDPLGYASEAASYLFEECYRQGVLTSEFFLDDKRILGKVPLKPDPQLRSAFFASVKRAQDLALL